MLGILQLHPAKTSLPGKSFAFDLVKWVMYELNPK